MTTVRAVLIVLGLVALLSVPLPERVELWILNGILQLMTL